MMAQKGARMGTKDQLHGIPETAARIGVSPYTVRRLIKNGDLRAVRVGRRRVLISEKEIVRVIDNGTRAA
jgi:excisionase family DNA binding protein